MFRKPRYGATLATTLIVSSVTVLSGCSNSTTTGFRLTAPSASMVKLAEGVKPAGELQIQLKDGNAASSQLTGDITHIVVNCTGGSVEITTEKNGQKTALPGSPYECADAPFQYERTAGSGKTQLGFLATGDVAATAVFGATQ